MEENNSAYFWGKYKNKPGWQLLNKIEGEFYTFAWDAPLSSDDLGEFSEIIPATLKTPDGEEFVDVV